MTYEISDSHEQKGISNLFVELVRFLKRLRYHKGLVAGCLLSTTLLSGLYYATATRLYESDAQLLVTQQVRDVMRDPEQSQGQIRDEMPTYVEIILSDKVLSKAIEDIDPATRTAFSALPPDKVLKVLRESLQVTSSRRTNLIDLKYRSPDPQNSVAVVRSVLKSFVDFMGEIHRDRSHEILKVLTTEKSSLEKKLADTEARLIHLKSESGHLIGSGEKSLNVTAERIAELNAGLVTAQKEALNAKTTYDTVSAALERGEDIGQFLIEIMGTLNGEMLREELGLGTKDQWATQQAIQQLLKDKSTLDNKLNTLGEAHPEILRLRQRIQATQTFLKDRREVSAQQIQLVRQRELGPRLLEIVRQRYLQAKSREQSLREQFEREQKIALGLNSQMAQIEITNSDLLRLRDNYHVLNERIRSIDLNQNEGVRISVVRDPQLPKQASSPKLLRTLTLGILAGLLGAAIAIVTLDTLDDRFRSPEELQSHIGIPLLAVVRKLTAPSENQQERLTVVARPNSAEAESFHMLRTVLGLTNEPNRSLTISSSEQGDGKTTVSSNLAAAFAQLGRRTLVIDGDMRRPGLTKMFQYQGSKGLSQILQGTLPIEQSARENMMDSGVPNLDFIPCGIKPINPSDLLTHRRFSEVVNWAESEYEHVIIDAPPITAVSDPLIIGSLTDGLILIVRPDKNRRRVVLRATDTLKHFGVCILGIVLNGMNLDRDNDGYGYGYGEEYSDLDFPSPSNTDSDDVPSLKETIPFHSVDDDFAEDFDGVFVSRKPAA
ncbi:MAG: polysaccharide biosynthesis tyrosine autokinase [Planctomycetaceae bacterium]|nr:polysaccharide biosynthesis tyrosine autokinase [Planctomycetaceae bacterium]